MKQSTEQEGDARLKELGWDGTSCRLCFMRTFQIQRGTWGVHFRFCPHCGAQWRQ